LFILQKKTNTVLLPPAYLPHVSWFYYYLNVENVFIEQFETYPKQTYRNRCSILSANGKLNLTIPVSKPDGNRTLTKDVKITDDKNWQQNHWRAICSAYLNSPFFEYYRDGIEHFYQDKSTSLIKLNMQLLLVLAELIGIKKGITHTDSYQHHPEDMLDLRTILNPKNVKSELNFPEYIQVFSSKFSFMPDLSILDVLFNLGPETLNYLKSIQVIKED